MRSRLGLLVVIAVVAAACTDDDDAAPADTAGAATIPSTAAPTPAPAETTATAPTVVETTAPDGGAEPTYEATIRRTTDGIPHVSGDSVADVLFGQGYANGQDHACTLADQLLKVQGRRAAAFGPGDDQRQHRQRLRLAGARHRRDRPRRLGDRHAGGRRGVRGVHRRVEPPTGRRGRRRPVRLVRRRGLGAADHRSRPLRLRPLGDPAGEWRSAHRLHRLGPATGRHAGDDDAAGRPARPAEHGEQRLGGRRRRRDRRRGRAPRRQPALPVGGRAALLGGPPHGARRGGHLRRQPDRAPRGRHRVHRRVRLVAHGVGGEPLHRVLADARPDRPDGLPRRRRAAPDDADRPRDRGAPARRVDHRRAADAVVERVRADHRLPRPRLDGDDDADLPRRQHRQRRVRRAVRGDDDGAELRRVRRRPP